MKIICDGADPRKVRIWTNNGIDITEDLAPMIIDFVVRPDEETLVVITCPVKGFVMNVGFEEPSIVEAPEDQNEN